MILSHVIVLQPNHGHIWLSRILYIFRFSLSLLSRIRRNCHGKQMKPKLAKFANWNCLVIRILSLTNDQFYVIRFLLVSFPDFSLVHPLTLPVHPLPGDEFGRARSYKMPPILAVGGWKGLWWHSSNANADSGAQRFHNPYFHSKESQ